MNKTKQRKILLEKRNKQPAQQQISKSNNIVKQLKTNLIDLHKHKKIGIYYSVRGEANPIKITNTTSNSFYLPKLTNNKSALIFAPMQADTQYENNKYGIPEPICEKDECINAVILDIVLMPLLGFDLHGNRIGMGGGYYDRCFSFKKEQSTRKQPLLIGFAFDLQEVHDIEAEPWDVKLDGIVTESRFILF